MSNQHEKVKRDRKKNIFHSISDLFYDWEVAFADLMDYNNPLWEKGYWKKAHEKVQEDQGKYFRKVFNLPPE